MFEVLQAYLPDPVILASAWKHALFNAAGNCMKAAERIRCSRCKGASPRVEVVGRGDPTWRAAFMQGM